MKISRKSQLFSLLLPVLCVMIFSTHRVFAQEEVEKEKLAEYREEVKQMVSFLQFSLNIIGDPTVSAKEKDIIIN